MPRLLLKHAPRSKTSALRAAWQGAMKSRRAKADRPCPLCRKPLTPQHMAMECKWWRGRVPPPPKHWERLKVKYPYECLWARGLMPASATRLSGYRHGPPSEQAQGICTQDTWSAQYFYATDASGGPYGRTPPSHSMLRSLAPTPVGDGTSTPLLTWLVGKRSRRPSAIFLPGIRKRLTTSPGRFPNTSKRRLRFSSPQWSDRHGKKGKLPLPRRSH